MPYFVPACALSTIGTRTMRLPRKMVSTACHQFMPESIMPEASMYVGTHADIEIHSTAMSRMPHRRPERGTGAMSWLKYGEPLRSAVSSSMPVSRTTDVSGVLAIDGGCQLNYFPVRQLYESAIPQVTGVVSQLRQKVRSSRSQSHIQQELHLGQARCNLFVGQQRSVLDALLDVLWL